MDKQNIIELINKKILEHEIEENLAIRALEMIKVSKAESKPSLITLQELAVNKDRMLFHKGARMVLIDLKKEVEDFV